MSDNREESSAKDQQGGISPRQLFELTLKKRDRDERIALAQGSSGPMLKAFCFDPDPGVILNGVLKNTHTGLDHARLIAANHRSAQGLHGLATRPQFVADRQVQQHLFRNTQSGEALLRRVFDSRPLQLLFQTLMGRDISERARQIGKQTFKKKFQNAQPEEKIGVVFASEGRCLRFLIGVALDGRSINMICGRASFSSLLIQNLARWPTAPPQVLRHLARQSFVRQNAGLKRTILQHPNCPKELKSHGF